MNKFKSEEKDVLPRLRDAGISRALENLMRMSSQKDIYISIPVNRPREVLHNRLQILQQCP